MFEQPREPIFYQNDQNSFTVNDNTLQSIDTTLKRIEKILIQLQNQFSTLNDQILLEQKSKKDTDIIVESLTKSIAESADLASRILVEQ